MSRVINPDSAGKQRNQHIRTIAEILRHLTQKPEMDAEAKDMIATMVYCLRDIDNGIEVSAEAWEKRDYWLKADELRTRWGWAGQTADQLQGVLLEDKWDQMPQLMLKILPHVKDVTITRLMRKPEDWFGNYARLLSERPPTK